MGDVLSDLETIRSAIKEAGSIRGAERLLDISERTIRRRLRDAIDDDYTVAEVPPEVDIDDLLAERIKKFKRLQKVTEATRVRDVHLKSNAPIGVGFFGDMHLDDDGTNLGKLLSHIALFDGRTPGLHGAWLGDLNNNWVGSLQRLWSEQSTNLKEAGALAEHVMGRVKWLFAVHGNHDCVSMDTECLTKRGWLRYSEIVDGDLVLGFNPKTEKAEWQPILHKFTRQNTSEMYHSTTTNVDMLITPNHRVLYKKDWNKTWRYKLAHELDAGQYNVPCAAIVENDEYPIYDDELRLAAWLLTDSGRDRNGYNTIYQSKPPTVSAIRDLLNRLGIDFHESVRIRERKEILGKPIKNPLLPAYEFYIRKPYGEYCNILVPDRSRMPSWVFELSKRQFDLFLGTLIDADGNWHKGGEGNSASLCKKPEWIDSFQAAAVSFGWRTNITHYGTYSIAYISTTPVSTVVPKKNTKVVPATGDVWCLSVPLTNFMVRRNGKAFFTGNCWNQKIPLYEYLMKSAGTRIMAAHEQRVRLNFPNGRTLLIHARHKFPGHSQWTRQFGQIKAAMLGGNADIYVGGDKHVSGYSNGWHDGVKKMWHALQVASYKEIDEYPVELGLSPADIYQCPVAIIDPKATGPLNFIRWEFDPEEGAERLEWLRSKA